MLFNSINFLLFFPIMVLSYYIIPQKYRHVWLLIVSYGFYMLWNPIHILLLVGMTIVTYISGRCMGKNRANTMQKEEPGWKKEVFKRRFYMIAAILINIGILIFFKYTNFVFHDLGGILEALRIQITIPKFDVMLPIGISFYTFKSISYVIDCYRGDIESERNILKYALYVAFFPQLASGPIERASSFLKQIDEKHRFELTRIRDGVLLMLWGLFQKMVIADRVAILVNQTFDYYQSYTGFQIVTAALFFTVQIYCDFTGYSNLAIGAAQVLGYQTMMNFNTPYFSKSVAEFWRRWHISLSSWFRDYLYIPLGGNRDGKKKKYRNIMIVFLISGLWHGAGWHYIIWGGLNGAYQIIGAELKPLKQWIYKKFSVKTDVFSHKLLQTMITFLLISITWVFFRAADLKSAIFMLIRMVQGLDIGMFFDGSLYTMNLNKGEFWIAMAGMAVLCFVSILQYKGMHIRATLAKQGLWFQYLLYLGIIFSILIFGVYGPSFDASEFIYLQF